MATAEYIQFMADAIAEARRGEADGEVPVGAIAVADGQIVGAGHNQPIGLGDPTAHAEIIAIRAAASTLKTYRLTAVSLYVTLEPCVMCVGAMVTRESRGLYTGRGTKRRARWLSVRYRQRRPLEPSIRGSGRGDGGGVRRDNARVLSRAPRWMTRREIYKRTHWCSNANDIFRKVVRPRCQVIRPSRTRR